MPLLPAFSRLLAQAALPEAERARLARLHFADAGHGYDAFGLHPDVVAFGEALVAPLYDHYFRVQSQGHAHIPTSGPAVLAGNHSGAIPTDAMMVWLDVLRHTEPPRVARSVADHFVPLIPMIGTLFARGGMVEGSRGNARTLLEAGELLVIFPDGVPGISQPFRDRYKPQDWRVGPAELALRHRAPVVPFAVVGAEEQMPQIGRIPLKLFGAPFLPVTLTPVPLPVRYHILYGEPIPVHLDYRPEQADDPGAVREASARVKSAVEGLIAQGLSERPGIFA